MSRSLTFGLSAFFFLLIYLWVYFPAIHSIDGIFYIINLQRSPVGASSLSYESYFYGLLLSILLPAGNGFALVSILQITLFSILLGLIYHLIYSETHSHWTPWATSLLLIFNPVTPQLLLLTERDILFSVFIGFYFFTLMWAQKKKDSPCLHLAPLFLTLAISFRKESLLLFLFFPLQLYFLGISNRQIARHTLTGAILIGTAWMTPKYFQDSHRAEEIGGAYDAGILIFPLTEFYRARGTPLTIQEREMLNKVFDIPPNIEIPEPQQWKIKAPLPIEDAREFTKFSIAVLVRNWRFYIAARTANFFHDFQKNPIEKYREQYTPETFRKEISGFVNIDSLLRNDRLSSTKQMLDSILDWVFLHPSLAIFFSPLHAILLPFLIFLFPFLAPQPKRLIILWLPFFLLLIVTLFLAPYMKPKYLYSLHLPAWVIWAIFINRLIKGQFFQQKLKI